MRNPYKPHIYWHKPYWRCVRQDPSRNGVLLIGDALTPKEAYYFCMNGIKYC